MGPMAAAAAEKRGTALLLRRYNRLKKTTATLLRCAEALTLTALAFWSSSHLPSAARSSSDLLRRLLPVLLGPRFLFLLANAIVLSLLLNNSRLHADDEISISIAISSSSFAPPPPPPSPAVPEVVYEDKRVCVEEAPSPRAACRRSRSGTVRERRRRSPELRRAETDVGKVKEEDEEEFRRTIEAFIEKQWRFQREESMAIVSCDAAPAADVVVVEEIEESKGK